MLSGAVNEGTQTFTPEGARQRHLPPRHDRRQRLRDHSTVQPVQHPDEELTGNDGDTTLVFAVTRTSPPATNSGS